jgi:TRAP-type C4-dicarboxylate transport system permease small subunit
MKASETSKSSQVLDSISEVIHKIVGWLAILGATVTVLMMLLIFGNVVGRFVFKQPITGTLELVEFMTVCAVFFAVAFAEYKKSNVKVDVFVSHLPRQGKKILEGALGILCSIFCFGMSYEAFQLMRDTLTPIVRESALLSIPVFPFLFFVTLGSFLLALEMLISVFHPVKTARDIEAGNI